MNGLFGRKKSQFLIGVAKKKEQFYLIEGEVTIKTHEAEYKVLPGDYVICPKGLSCNWEITKYAKKHYHFVEK